MFGVFETYYVSSLISAESESNVAWIGSLQGFLLFVVGGISGPLYDVGYLRPLLYVGSCFIIVGMMLTSVCKSYWQLLLAQGVLMGLGNGLLFVTGISLLPQYFTTRKSFATGVASFGSNVGQQKALYSFVFGLSAASSHHQLQSRQWRRKFIKKGRHGHHWSRAEGSANVILWVLLLELHREKTCCIF